MFTRAFASLYAVPTPLRRIATLAVLLGATRSVGCAAFAPVIEEPMRIENVRDLDATALRLEPGVSTVDEARERLLSAGITGVTEDAYATTSGASVEVVGADYQRRIHVFRGGKYAHSFTLPTHGVPPYGVTLRLGTAARQTLLFVLYRDPLARAAEPPGILAYAVAPDATLTLVARASLGDVVARQGGMSRPLLVGSDFDDGVMLVARDAGGALWDESVLLRFRGGQIEHAPRPITEALRCSCVRKYAVGATAH